MSDYLTGLGGYPLFLLPIEVSQAPNSSYAVSRQFISAPGTRTDVITHTTNLAIKYSISFTNLDYAEIEAFYDFVYNTARGRLNPFWAPIEMNLFTASADYLATDTVLAIEPNVSVQDFRGYERIFLLLSNGDLLTYQVISIEPGLNEDDPYMMTIATALGRDIDKDDIDIFGKLLFMRSDTDTIKVTYQTETIAQSSLDLLELVEEYPL